MELRKNPIEGMDYSFKTYLANRKAENACHMDGNAIPDYAYGMDYRLRKRIDSIPGVFSLADKLVLTQASITLQRVNQQAVCATPSTLPDIYDIGCECARRLGTTIPNIYVLPSTQINAFTISTDDTEPVIVLYSALYERLTPGELKVIIGHECGHFQNHHLTYMNLAKMLLEQGITGAGSLAGASIQNLLSESVSLALKSWSRAAEVTADRAGMICADSLDVCLSALSKLMYGAAFGEHQVNYESLKEQLWMQMNNASRYLELEYDHPSTVRRMLANEEFAQCRIYYEWRPDLKKPDSIMRSREECDERCKKYIDLNKNAKR